MPSFQIVSLSKTQFQPYFNMSDTELEKRGVIRQIVRESPGSPCRVSLRDAAVGGTVILLNYEHLPNNSPYQSSHAIFIREHAEQRILAADEIPASISGRLISVRVFDQQQIMIDADCVAGTQLDELLPKLLASPGAQFIHLHNAKPGCFAARVERC